MERAREGSTNVRVFVHNGIVCLTERRAREVGRVRIRFRYARLSQVRSDDGENKK